MISKILTPIFFASFATFINTISADNGDMLFNWSGAARTTSGGWSDAEIDAMGVIPVLPSQFGVNVTAVYDKYGSKTSGDPLTVGHKYVCKNGQKYKDNAYGPQIYWNKSDQHNVTKILRMV